VSDLDKLVSLAVELDRQEIMALAMEHVPDYSRASSRGNMVRVSGYSRMGEEGMQQHITGSHGMQPGHFGSDFSHPQSLGQWHAMDHLARGGSGLGHQHSVSRAGKEPVEHPLEKVEHAAAGHSDHAGGGEHGGHGVLGIAAHHLLREGPLMVHREVRRTGDREVRRRLFERGRHGGKHGPKGAGVKGVPGGGASSAGASGGGSGGGSGGSGGSGGGSGNSQ
jgi:hypothetical protein